MGLVELVDSDIDVDRLKEATFSFLLEYDLIGQQQVSLTSIDGNNDWRSANGKIRDLKHPERFYSVINNALAGTYIEECINRYPMFYRWRLLKLKPKETYTVHRDGDGVQTNIRLHIPVTSNDQSFLAFYDSRPVDNSTNSVYYKHLDVGSSYQINTTSFHTAVNYGNTDRYHIVGVRYENSDNGTH